MPKLEDFESTRQGGRASFILFTREYFTDEESDK